MGNKRRRGLKVALGKLVTSVVTVALAVVAVGAFAKGTPDVRFWLPAISPPSAGPVAEAPSPSPVVEAPSPVPSPTVGLPPVAASHGDDGEGSDG